MLIELRDVSYVYGKGTVYETAALDHVSLKIKEGEFIGIIGHTGSGKSTLIQQMNGLMRPTDGQVLYHGDDIWSEGYDLRALRTHVGLVFQYPENQLFETDVLTDVEFGPKNQGLSKEDCEERAKRALTQVGVPEELYTVSPFELSGGQKRRVAIAGVLAMDPEVLILDEPTAGLDPQGRDEVLGLVKRLHDTRGITVILVSHSMEDVASYTERLIVVNDGRIPYDASPRQVFLHYRELEKMGLAAPQVTYLMHALREHGLPVDVTATTVDEAKRSILLALSGKKLRKTAAGAAADKESRKTPNPVRPEEPVKTEKADMPEADGNKDTLPVRPEDAGKAAGTEAGGDGHTVTKEQTHGN